MAAVKYPMGLSPGGKSLWKAVFEAHELDACQLVQLEEACRAKDRLDQMNDIIAGKGVLQLLHFRSMLGEFDEDERHIRMTLDGVIDKANTTANTMKQLLAALRLPDPVTGKKPQFRGARGAHRPATPGGKVSSLDRARAAKSS